MRYKGTFGSLVSDVGLLILEIYRQIGSLFLGGGCRFEPSCSAYAKEALHKHSFGCASYLIITRILKCRPFGPFGWDPVPERKSS